MSPSRVVVHPLPARGTTARRGSSLVEFTNVAQVWEELGGHCERRDRGGAGELG